MNQIRNLEVMSIHVFGTGSHYSKSALDRVLARVKNMLNDAFPITLRRQFPNLGQPGQSYVINNQLI